MGQCNSSVMVFSTSNTVGGAGSFVGSCVLYICLTFCQAANLFCSRRISRISARLIGGLTPVLVVACGSPSVIYGWLSSDWPSDSSELSVRCPSFSAEDFPVVWLLWLLFPLLFSLVGSCPCGDAASRGLVLRLVVGVPKAPDSVRCPPRT